jgi:hypothetical protein
VSAERVCSAGENVGDGTPVRGQHRRAIPRQIVVGEPAEDVSECDYDSSSGSQIGHELVEGRLERGACGLGSPSPVMQSKRNTNFVLSNAFNSWSAILISILFFDIERLPDLWTAAYTNVSLGRMRAGS